MPNFESDIEKLLVDYLEHCEIEKNLTQSSIKYYHFYLRDFIEWSKYRLKKDKLYLNDIDHDHIRKYRINLNRRTSSKSQQDYKKTTQKVYLVALRAFLRYLDVEKGLPVPSPDQIILGKPEASVPSFLNDDQLKDLFEVQNLNKRSGIRDRAILETLFSTGLRVSELVSLDVDSINLDTGEFTVIGKGRKPRTVYLGESARRWLHRYLSTRNDPYKPLFLRHSGKKMDPDDEYGESLRLTVRSVQRLVKKYVTRAGISVDATPHTLRHTFATGLLMNGADIRSVQEMLGHASVQTTQIYTHVTNERLREVHSKFHKDINAEDNFEPSTLESESDFDPDPVSGSSTSDDSSGGISSLF